MQRRMHPGANDLRQAQRGKPQEPRVQRVVRQRPDEIRRQCRPLASRHARQIDHDAAGQVSQPDLRRQRRQHLPVQRRVPPRPPGQRARAINIDRHQRRSRPDRQPRTARQIDRGARQGVDRLRHILLEHRLRHRHACADVSAQGRRHTRIVRQHRRIGIARRQSNHRVRAAAQQTHSAIPRRPPAPSAAGLCRPAPRG